MPSAYADDIAVLSASCYGLQKITDICSNCDTNGIFNPVKSQLMAVGINNPARCTITLNKQEAQLMLTTGAMRLAISRGQQTWYHFGSVATFR